MKPMDASARILALSPHQSFICEAPAGSGKTELLTQRVLTLLTRVKYPEAVLAITFTRKAAAEMRERVMHALQSGQGPEPEDSHKKNTWRLAQAALQHDTDRGWDLLMNPARLQIKTFDGLARQLMQSLPLQAGLDASWQPADDPSPLYQEAARNVLDAFERDTPWSDALGVLLKHLDNRYDIFENLLVDMLKNRDAWMPILGVQQSQEMRTILERFLHQTVTDKIANLQEYLSPFWRQQLRDLIIFAAHNLKRQQASAPLTLFIESNTDELPGCTVDGIAHWRALAQWLLTQKGELRKKFTKNEGFPVGEGKVEKAAFKAKKETMEALLTQLGEVPDLVTALADIQHWPSLNYTAEQWPVLNALTQVLPIVVAHLHWVFQKHKTLDFTEVSQRARRALGEEGAPTDLMQRLDYTIEHILVDEFQDTSFTQIDLLKKLTVGWQPDDGRTLFCVGDAMQSIYSFRGANVGLFLHCKEAGLGDIALAPLHLSANFRSQAGVVDWVNRTFARAFPSQMDISSGAVPYSLAQPFRPASADGVSTHIFPPNSAVASANWFVSKLREEWRQRPQSRIGVLVKSRHHADALVAALAQAQIRYRAVDMVPLAAREVIQDALSLTYALLNPGDRVAWLAVLRAPWCGLLLSDLTILAEAGDPTATLFEQIATALTVGGKTLSPDGRGRLNRIYPILRDALANRNRKPLAIWVGGTWRALGGQALVAEPADEHNLERYWQVLETLGEKGLPDKRTLERAVDALYAAPDPLADGLLQIMTIHKSKGLEFDVVFLPQLQRKSANVDQDLLLWQERLSHSGEETLLLAPISALGPTSDPIYQHLLHEKKRRLKLESCRLLYVACTRARERLYLLAELESTEDASGFDASGFKAPTSGSLLEHIWPYVAHEAQAEESPIDQQLRGDDLTQALLKRVPSNWQTPPIISNNVLTPYILAHEYGNQSADLKVLPDWEVDLTRHIGSVVHQAAEWIGRRGINGIEQTFQQLRQSFDARLRHLGVASSDRPRAIAAVDRIVTSLISHPQYLWLLAQPQCYFEYPVNVRTDSGVDSLILDVLVVTDEGQAWVVDYKTSEPAMGEAKVDFLQREKSLYKAAMNRYQVAVKKLGYQSVNAALFFVATGDWLPLETGTDSP